MLVTRSYYIWLPKIILGRFPLDIPGRKMLRTVEAVVKNKNKKCSEIREKKLSTQTSGTSLNLILGAIKPLSALSSSIYVNFFYPQSWKDTAFVCNWRIDQLASESTSVTHRESFKRDYSCLDKKTQRTNQLGMEQAHKIEAFCIKIVKVALKHHSAIFVTWQLYRFPCHWLTS